MNKNFTLRYLPLFEQDLMAARNYIAQNLQNPIAALRLVEDAEVRRFIYSRRDLPNIV